MSSRGLDHPRMLFVPHDEGCLRKVSWIDRQSRREQQLNGRAGSRGVDAKRCPCIDDDGDDDDGMDDEHTKSLGGNVD